MNKNFKKYIFQHPYLYSLYLTSRNLSFPSIFRANTYKVKDIVVCGMARSGSTLLFNIIKEMVKFHYQKVDPYFINDREYANLLQNEISLFIKKNHRFTFSLKRRFAKKLTYGFFTHRDIRDVVVSLMQIGRITDFEKWVADGRLRKIVNDALLYSRNGDVTMIEYDDLVNNKLQVINSIAEKLKLKLSENEIEWILNKTDIESTKQQLSLKENNEIDLTNHLHKNHISDGKIGKWKEVLSKEQIEVINELTKDFLKFFNYKV